jgi:hypothetical protein
MNLYSFSLNNPVRYYDPDGRDAKKSKTLPSSCELFGFGCGKKGSDSEGESGDEEGPEGPEGEAGEEAGEIKDLISSEDGTPDGETDTVEVAILDGWFGFIPAVTIRVSPDTAKAIDGAGIVSLVITGAAGLAKKFAKKAIKKAVDDGWTNVSRWMGKNEAGVWKGRSSIPQPRGKMTQVTKRGAPRPGAAKSDVRVDFQVPSSALQKGGLSEWFNIFNEGRSIPIRDVKQVHSPLKD